jgi:lysozyme
MQISECGITLTKENESCCLTAYPDPATGGKPWTIGWGTTIPVDGVPVHQGMTITQEQADRALINELNHCAGEVSTLVKVSVTQGQFDALVDFAYNIGIAALAHSTLLRELNAGDTSGAAAEFPKWNHANGKVMRGLTVRRYKEQMEFVS